MLDVHNTKNYLNYDINNKVNYDKLKTVESDSDVKQNVSSKIENSSASSDSIEITQKDQKVINAKKAKDAFFETCSDMSSYYCIVLFQMKQRGIDTSSFSLGSSSFVDVVKEFAKKVDMEGPGAFPSNFLGFCDAYKQKLIQCGL